MCLLLWSYPFLRSVILADSLLFRYNLLWRDFVAKNDGNTRVNVFHLMSVRLCSHSFWNQCWDRCITVTPLRKSQWKHRGKDWIPLFIFTCINSYKPCLWFCASRETIHCLKWYMTLASCKEECKGYVRIHFRAGTRQQMGKNILTKSFLISL